MQLATFARSKIQPPRFRAGLVERSELERVRTGCEALQSVQTPGFRSASANRGQRRD